ncbi:MAG: hypothetical protein ACW96X_07490 [Promethearchaeota archaeon]|jgi:MFS family permease
MHNQEDDPQRDNKVIISWLAHHNPKRNDFDDHVIYIFNHAICIGCSAFILGTTAALILGNLFYNYIIYFFSLPIILIVFFICWIPSILQYSIQIIRKKPFKNRAMKFLIRFLYPLGSIIFIFKSPLWGFGIAVPAGYFIIYIRKLKDKSLVIE